MSEEMNIPFKGVALIKRCLDYARHDKGGGRLVDMTGRGKGFLFFQKYPVAFNTPGGGLFGSWEVIDAGDGLLAA